MRVLPSDPSLFSSNRIAGPRRLGSQRDATLYDVLGLSPSATGKEIDAACVRLGEQFHPDRNQGNPYAAFRFKQIETAFDILCDQEKRGQYDAWLLRQSVTKRKYPRAKRRASFRWGMASLTAVLLIAGGLILLPGAQEGSFRKSARVTEEHPDNKELVTSHLKDQVKSTLKDPSSARFRNIRLYQTMYEFKSGKKVIGGERTLCGEMNGRNVSGASVGFRSFFSSAVIPVNEGKAREGTHVSMIFDPHGGQRLQKLFRKYHSEFCRDKTLLEQGGRWVEKNVVVPVPER